MTSSTANSAATNGTFDVVDVVIVGAGISGAIIALQLATRGKRVLILEAGPAVPTDRSGYMNNFYMNVAKAPEPPYPPLELAPGKQATPRTTIDGTINTQAPGLTYLIP